MGALENPSVKHNPGVEVELHSRFVQPFLDMNLLLLGLPLVLTRQSRSLFFSVRGLFDRMAILRNEA